jgi:hypothetical protein
MPLPAAGIDPALANQLHLIKLLVDQGVPQESIPALLATMQNGFPSVPPTSAPPAPQYGQVPQSNSWGQVASRPEESRDRHEYNVRSPDRYAARSRSRSPPRQWGRDSPRGNGDRKYASHGHESPGRSRNNWQSNYRERSSTPPSYDRPSSDQKWFTFDRTIPAGHIKGMMTILDCNVSDTNISYSSQ